MRGRKYPIFLGTVITACVVACSILMLVSFAEAGAANPVPFLNQPLVPDAARPGGPDFTLTVNGTGFVPTSVVRWNGSDRPTQFVSQGQLSATIFATDIAKAGSALVTVYSPGPGGGTSVAVSFTVAEPELSVPFVKSDISAPGGNTELVAADFNGDGQLDLATTDYYEGVLRVFLGNGDGTFRAAPAYGACNPHALTVGDFNGDGIADIAFGERSCSRVTILLGNGDGTFRRSGSYGMGPTGPWGGPYSVATGDFNGDGILDLVTAQESDVVSVFLGNGDGTFRNHIEYATVVDGRKVAVGDFNRDGKLDIAVSSGSAALVSVLLGNGDGTFQPQTLYQIQGTDNPFLIAADLNGDGNLDLAVAGNGWVLLGNGDGTFRLAGQYSSVGGAAVASGDFNGDGIVDLVTSNYWSSTISLLLGNGDATFQSPVDYPSGNGARGIAVGDFDGDGRLDLAVGNQFVDTISIYLQTGSGPRVQLSPASLSFAPYYARLVGVGGPYRTVTLTNTGTTDLAISKITSVAEFPRKHNCPATLAPAASCTIQVWFLPKDKGVRTGTLAVTDNAPGSPHKVSLTGNATYVKVSTTLLNFGNQGVGTTSAPQTITLTNTATTALTFNSISLSGLQTQDFSQTNDCGTGLAAGASCTIKVTFTPTAPGLRKVRVYVNDDGGGSPQRVCLQGNGT